jgi:hypothetical protein
MATNTYTYGSLGERWTIGEPTSKDRLDLARNKADANRWSLLQLLVDPDDTANFDLSGITTPMRVGAAWKIAVDTGVTWTVGWWQASDGRWFLLVNTADVSSFARADAEFYIPTGDIADVPTS